MSEEAKNQLVHDKPKRRLLLGLTTLLGAKVTAHLTSGNALSIAMAYEPRHSDDIPTGKLFTQAQMKTLRTVCQTVIPATETLGAADVDTHGFIDNQLFHCFDKTAQQSIIKITVFINELSQRIHTSPFHRCSPEQQHRLLIKLDAGKDVSKNELSQFKFLKSLIVFGYYTSEVGASEELQYDTIPGDFKGSVSYDSIGSAWGSLAYF